MNIVVRSYTVKKDKVVEVWLEEHSDHVEVMAGVAGGLPYHILDIREEGFRRWYGVGEELGFPLGPENRVQLIED